MSTICFGLSVQKRNTRPFVQMPTKQMPPENSSDGIVPIFAPPL
ncbi:hypothetical protein HMPREF0602_0130 [Neisseria meningitidis ATCC 13091]|uniref:Uncharacterized protein n=1 Tax=Neisseria meningitidis serogroup B (strain ATCC 13091 / M2091) TaxID=862513 RepID=E0N6K0_NEIM3|nr:hypothetical protein HMPREF0602_0130 [Neisseria meningitidis ATCC 13091]